MSAVQSLKEVEASISHLHDVGVQFVRLQFSDLHGIPRGKVVPMHAFSRVAHEGLAFAGAVMTLDLRHNTIAGLEEGIPDMRARPDLSTLVQLPWEPHVAWCLCDLEDPRDGQPYAVDPRNTLRRVVENAQTLGFTPVLGPELEFYLCEIDDRAPQGVRRYLDRCSPVYTVGGHAEPRGVLERMLRYASDLRLGAYAANLEYGRGQFEINLQHSPALDSADRAFRYKALVKEVAAREGLLATFMGKPWNDDEGSGFHLHVSLSTGDGANAFDDPHAPHGLSRTAEHFLAGVLEHTPALMAFLNPTVNAYRRINSRALVPSRVNWGYDHRFALARIPREGGHARRIEIRVGDASANPYLCYAAIILAGLDGIRREMTPPEPIEGALDNLPEKRRGRPLPTSLGESLEALKRDDIVRQGLGEVSEAFLTVKQAELSRFMQWTTDWEIDEYLQHL